VPRISSCRRRSFPRRRTTRSRTKLSQSKQAANRKWRRRKRLDLGSQGVHCSPTNAYAFVPPRVRGLHIGFWEWTKTSPDSLKAGFADQSHLTPWAYPRVRVPRPADYFRFARIPDGAAQTSPESNVFAETKGVYQQQIGCSTRSASRSNYSGAAHLQQRALGSQVGFDSKLTANP
jgi:hypothetical protein